MAFMKHELEAIFKKRLFRKIMEEITNYDSGTEKLNGSN